ncbi:MAG: ferrous iron transporter B, partial [Desulfitobacterium sp.]|nr:ferrous iron transporter B [Desulfitobacterium sp.]
SGLRLALEVKKYNVPMVFALNMVDVAERKGIKVNIGLLSQKLGSPVIPTIAVKNQGLEEIREELSKAVKSSSVENESYCQGSACGGSCGSCGTLSVFDYWEQAKELTRQVVTDTNKNPSFLDRLGEQMMKPWPGIPIAILVVILSLAVVVGGGKGLRAGLLLPLVNNIIVPFFRSIFSAIIPDGVFQNILIGEYGIFVISFEWIIALVLPYVLVFQIVFSFLEDSGYLPRISVLFDNIMRKLGVQGGSLINIMLGFGCAVPAIIGTRAATTKKERLMVTTMICFAIPCISQTGAIISLTGSYSFGMVLAAVLTGFIIFITTGIVSSKIYKGQVDPLVIEVPALLLPNPKAYLKKLMVRFKQFVIEAEGPMLIAVVIAAVFKESGALDAFARILEPLMAGWLGMPKEAIIVLILGIVRREMAVAPLISMNLDPLQMFVGVVVALLYLPCLSVFGILAKEFKARVAVGIALSTTFAALFVGGLVNQIGTLMGF